LPPPPPVIEFPAPPPQPVTIPETRSAKSPIVNHQFLRRRGSQKRKAPASATPPADAHKRGFISPPALVAAVVLMVRVEGCCAFPLIATAGGARLQVAGSLAAEGVIEQLRFTVPENPFEGTT
jgi:hypothetical protein